MSAPRKKTKSGEPGWAWRRIFVFPMVGFACWRLVMLETAADTRVNDTLAFGWTVLVAVLVLGYVGFATAQDIAAIMATRSGLPYSPESSPAEATPGTDAVADSQVPPPGAAG